MCWKTISKLWCISSIRSQYLRGPQIPGTMFPRQLNFVWLCLIFTVPLLQSFSSHTKMCISSHVPNRKHPITARFTVNSSTVSLQCGTCFISLFWQLKFGGDSWGFWKSVNPCSNFSLISYTGYWKIPNLTY